MYKTLSSILTATLLILLLSSCQIFHTHSYTDTIIDATCNSKGITISTCSCGKQKTTEIQQLDHEFIGYICSYCKYDIRTSDVYKYFEIKEYSDKLALYITKQYVLKENDKKDIEFLSFDITEYDQYLNYITRVIYKYTDENGYPKMVDQTNYIQLIETLEARAYCFEVTEGINTIDYYKSKFGWSKNINNITYSFLEAMKNPESVSFNDVLASPELYKGKYISVEETLFVLSNYDGDTTDPWMYTYISPNNTTNYLTIRFEIYNPIPIAMYSTQKINIEGIIEISDNGKPFLEIVKYELVD